MPECDRGALQELIAGGGERQGYQERKRPDRPERNGAEEKAEKREQDDGVEE
jgi:hypothetical protein